jgi:hypothetical protein
VIHEVPDDQDETEGGVEGSEEWVVYDEEGGYRTTRHKPNTSQCGSDIPLEIK